MTRYSIVKASTAPGFLIWDDEVEDFIRKDGGALREFDDATLAQIFIEENLQS